MVHDVYAASSGRTCSMYSVLHVMCMTELCWEADGVCRACVDRGVRVDRT